MIDDLDKSMGSEQANKVAVSVHSKSGDERLVAELVRRRAEYCFPVKVQTMVREFASDVLGILFPHFSDTHRCDSLEISAEVERLESTLADLATSLATTSNLPETATAHGFMEALPGVHAALMLDARAIYHGDPAATSLDEVILCYPGFLAICLHRVAHVLFGLGFPLLPRLLSEHAHMRTGIDIHPGATIGPSFFIDHGTGVVVGETAHIGNGVKLYQGVTIGAAVVQRELRSRKRHPTLEDNVVVYANATILGGDTVIGHDSIIGGNAWITESVPPFSAAGRNSEVRPRRPGGDDLIEFNI